ncbi:MAG: SPOR domain-containing protein [Paracoccaceae bacterium]
MTQVHFGAYHAAAPSYQQPAGQDTLRMGRLVNLAGAVLSVILVVGMGVWSYRLMVRDVTGVPVIRALAGPMRISPADPGGRQAAYQGLAVNSVAAEGEAAAAAQVVSLAPPPVQLSDEDRAAAALLAQRGQPITAPTAPAISVPLNDLAGNSGAFAPLTLVASSVPGVSRSPVPRQRPTTYAVSNPALAPTAMAAAAPDSAAEALLSEVVSRLAVPDVTEIDPSTLAPGTRLVQLGAYDDASAARAAWNGLATRFPAYLEGRARIVEPAVAGGRTFYRLRAHGFSDEPEARRFCSVFLADNVDCTPVLIR